MNLHFRLLRKTRTVRLGFENLFEDSARELEGRSGEAMAPLRRWKNCGILLAYDDVQIILP